MFLPYIWARFTARLYANQPSPVLKLWGFGVWASRMMPKPSSKGLNYVGLLTHLYVFLP